MKTAPKIRLASIKGIPILFALLLAFAHAARPDESLSGLQQRAEVVLIGKAVAHEPTDDPWFSQKYDAIRVATAKLEVVDVLKGGSYPKQIDFHYLQFDPRAIANTGFRPIYYDLKKGE